MIRDLSNLIILHLSEKFIRITKLLPINTHHEKVTYITFHYSKVILITISFSRVKSIGVND